MLNNYLVEVPDLEHGLAIMQRILKQAIPRRKRAALTPQYRPIRQRQPPQQLKVMITDGVADVDGPTRDGAGGGVEMSAGVGGLEHVPVGVDEVGHPEAVVGAVHHVASLQPECPVRVPRWVRAPEIVACD